MQTDWWMIDSSLSCGDEIKTFSESLTLMIGINFVL